MAETDKQKKTTEKKQGPEETPPSGPKPAIENETIDMEKIDKIVERMKKKYFQEGVEFEEVGGKLKELREIIAEGDPSVVEIQKVEELRESKIPTAKFFGNIYLSLKNIITPLQSMLSRSKRLEEIGYYLYSANMKYSAKQYMAIVIGASIAAFVFGLIVSAVFFPATDLPFTTKIILGPGLPLGLCFIAFAVGILLPKNMAKRRGDATSLELPFALRHMATELKAGIGLYRTIQAIAVAEYGPLSEEFARTVTEIEEGTDAKDALKHLALRTQSKALRSAIMHIIRALETGGNLSTIMNEIAEDVSFELRLKMRDFSQKMNFFGLIFIFSAIVLPVIITILGIIRNSPISESVEAFQKLPLSVGNITIIFVIIIPLILIMLIGYIKAIQPRV